MATVKFSTKNVSIFGKLQSVEGTPVQPITTDVLAVTDLVGTINQETEAFQYLGDDLSRDEETTLKDTSIEVTCTAFMPVLGVIDIGLAEADSPYYQWFKACGSNPTVDSTTGFVTVDNKTANTSLLTIEYRKSSPEVSTPDTQKTYVAADCRGMVDVAFTAGSKATLGFKYVGNDSVPTMEPSIVADFQSQKFNVGSVVRKTNMIYSRISEIVSNQTPDTIENIQGVGGTVTVTMTGHSFVVGEGVAIAGTTNYDGYYTILTADGNSITFAGPSAAAETTGTCTKRLEIYKTMCTNSFNAPNFFGFDYERYLLTCQEGFSKTATPTDVNLVVLEDEAGGTDFDPDANIEGFFEVEIKYGTAAGKYVTIKMDKLQLAGTTDTSIGQYFGKDIKFRNTGNSTLIFS